MDWMFLPLKRYADFSGRSRRKEYWMFWLFQVLVLVFLALILFVVGFGEVDPYTGEPEFTGAGIAVLSAMTLFVLAILVPNISVTVRRFHDQGKSGWMYLLNFIPYVGGIIVFVFMLLPGKTGENEYGSDPKMIDNVDDIFS
jgi:uncharacterized membrane protein YhaH (DUF805 family)